MLQSLASSAAALHPSFVLVSVALACTAFGAAIGWALRG